MTNLSVFNFESHEIRFVGTSDAPLWVAVDICKVLEFSNPNETIKRLDDEDRTLISIEGINYGRSVNCVNESGLYSLILISRKPQAKRFKKWLTSEVIPSIRKTGSYGTGGEHQQPIAVLDNLDELKSGEALLQLEIKQRHIR
ncbi:BRO-N domain-containing protein [Nostoc sp.]|uniref:BRO-N domain-containing protein n=1 Tax=Nostoc sp. TaxID=1180 RepID=UPI002FF6D1EC